MITKLLRDTAPDTDTSSARRPGRRALAGAMAIMTGGLASAAIVAGLAAPRATTPPPSAVPSTPQLVAMDDSPAVQFVTDYQSATVTWHRAVANLGKLVNFANTNRTSVHAWSHHHYHADSEIIVSQFLTHADSYLSAGKAQAASCAAAESGSAWGVSANGYLVTNNHVLQPPSRTSCEQNATVGGPSSQTTAAQAVAGALRRQLQHINWGNRQLTLTAADLAGLDQLAAQWIAGTSTVSGWSERIVVGGGQTVSATDPGMAARVVVTSRTTWPHADVAILKVNATNLPVVPLGDDTIVNTGDTVEALGYPGVASFESGTAEHSTVTATFSSGQVTNRLETPGGFAAIENSATINHGSSGGPLLNAHGQVIGMVTAVDKSTDTANAINGGKFFYAIPISLVRHYLQLAGIAQHISPEQVTWGRAMALMQQSHYQAALTDLRHVQAAGYSTPYAMMHIQMIKAAIRNGDSKPLPPPSPGTAMLALTVAAILTGTGFVLTLVLTRRRKTRPAPETRSSPGVPAPPHES
jgi:S1-C subfamily serine protease